jgi:cell division septal protein FtsQ
MLRRGGASRFRFRVLPSVLLTAAILALPAVLYAWGRQADAFTIERVSVAGERRIPEEEALRLLRKEFLGSNLFTVTTADVRAALDKLPYLASVEVDRDFPTTLRVRLIEHRPAAYVLAKGRWFMVADSGHVIRELDASVAAPSVTPSNSPAATGAAADLPADGADATGSTAADVNGSTDAAEADQPAASDASAVAAALAQGPPAMKPTLARMSAATLPRTGQSIADDGVLAGLRVLAALPVSLRARVQVVRVDAGGQVALVLREGPRVELGGEERMVAKVLALRAVLAAYRRAGTAPTLIDVSAPDRPLGRPRLSP